MRLEGKVAIVTGAGQGIGETIALTFAREGARVVVADMSPESAEKVVNKIKSAGCEAEAVKTDIRIGGEITEMVRKTIETFKSVDILVNNAGIRKFSPSLDVSEAEWADIVNVNLKGTFLCCQAAGRQMVKQGGGKIVNIASIVGHVGLSGQAAYCCSKAGVLHLTRALAVEWGKYRVNVNSVSPGMTETETQGKNKLEKSAVFATYLDKIPTRRTATTQDIANAVLFLASSEADDITGQDIRVDGGTTVVHPAITKIE